MKTNIEHKGIIAWFTTNPVAANLLMLFLILAGILTAFTIRKEVFPESKPERVSVSISYPGASPEDVEEGIVKKVEESLEGVDGIKEIEATAYEGFAYIDIEAKVGENVNELVDNVKSKVDGIDSFPEQAEKPVISEVILKTEVLWLVIYGNIDDRKIKNLATRIRDDLVTEDGVSQANLIGTRAYEISIDVSEDSLKRFNLTFDEVTLKIQSQSVDLPGGSIKTKGENILLRSDGKAKTGHDFEEIVIKTRSDGTKIRVKDIAVVKDSFADEDWFLRYNGKNAVGIQVFRTGNESTLSVAKAVKNFMKQEEKLLPPGVEFDIMADMSVPLTERLELMLKNMLMGGTLVFIALALFLRLKIAFWVMMGIPVSFLGALWMMPFPFIDATINMITLYGFILVLGIVVDDAIVIGESIHDTIENEGSGVNSVIKGAKAVATPATFGVLTTVAAFIPMLTIPGTQGKIWSAIGYVVILCLIFSLVESKLVLPAHLLKLKDPSEKEKKSWVNKLQQKISKRLNNFLETKYRPALEKALKYRYSTITAFICVFALTMASVQFGYVKFVFFPAMDSDMVQVDLKVTRGTPKKLLVEALEKIEDASVIVNKEFLAAGEDINPIERFISYSESDSSAGIFVELSSGEERKHATSEIVNRWRALTEDVRKMPGVKSLKYRLTLGESPEAPIDFKLTGRSDSKLDKIISELKLALSKYKGVSDITDTNSDSKTEVKLKLKPGAESLGITLMDIAKQVRQAFYGEKIQKLQRGNEEVDVFIRYPESERGSIADLESMWIRDSSGKAVPITTIAEIEIGKGPVEIIREDKKRVVSVTADVDKKTTPPQNVIMDIAEKKIPKLLEKYPGVKFSIGGEAEEEQESLKSMKKWSVLALFAIFALMAIPLKSYVKPFIIMTAIPFGIVGAIIGHYIMGISVSILSLCGMIALAGVVVNDSLVMVDYINIRIENGDEIQKAVSNAGVRRFRAIMLTSITTFFGLLPMVVEKSLQAQFLIPMAVSLAYGILFSTIITLFLIPSLYLVWDDVQNLFKKKNKNA